MTETIDALVPLQQYQQGRAHLLPSMESARWYVRQHRAELIDAGATLMVAGRLMVAPAAFDAFVLEQGKRDAVARARDGRSR